MSQSHLSHMERQFIRHNIQKRSKQYFDIARLNSIERRQQASRRMPSNSNQTIQTKLDDSFVSSNELLNLKVHHDLSYFHKKRQEAEQTETNYTNKTVKTGVIDMDKMLNRSSYDKKYLAYRNQQQFNNFYIAKHRPKMSLDFTKFIGREKRSLDKQPKSQEQQQTQQFNSQRVGQLHEKMIFNQGNACLVHYSKSKTTKQRYDEAPIYQLSKIKRGEDLTKRKINPQLGEFYHGHGRYSPSQFDNRLLHENEYFWKNIKAERQKLKDYSSKKKKQGEIAFRLDKIFARKKLPDVRQQSCDQKFFRRNF